MCFYVFFIYLWWCSFSLFLQMQMHSIHNIYIHIYSYAYIYVYTYLYLSISLSPSIDTYTYLLICLNYTYICFRVCHRTATVTVAPRLGRAPQDSDLRRVHHLQRWPLSKFLRLWESWQLPAVCWWICQIWHQQGSDFWNTVVVGWGCWERNGWMGQNLMS